MRNLRLLIVLIFILIVLITFGDKSFFNQRSEKNKTEDKLYQIPSKTPTPASNAADATPTPVKTEDNINSPQVSTEITSFIYPNSVNIRQNKDTSSMESSDQPQIITDWYKEKIKSMGMKATAFTQTTTNGNVLNKLAGANNSFAIVVEIRKAEFDTKTSIRLVIKD